MSYWLKFFYWLLWLQLKKYKTTNAYDSILLEMFLISYRKGVAPKQASQFLVNTPRMKNFI